MSSPSPKAVKHRWRERIVSDRRLWAISETYCQRCGAKYPTLRRCVPASKHKERPERHDG